MEYKDLKLFLATNTFPMVLTDKTIVQFLFIDGRFVPLSNDHLDCEIQDYKFIVRSDLYEDIKDE